MSARTFGLTHLALAVRDPERSLAFYRDAFGVKEYFRDESQIQVKGPGPHDVIAFERDAEKAGRAGGIIHFGFRLPSPDDMEGAVQAVLHCAFHVIRRGQA